MLWSFLFIDSILGLACLLAAIESWWTFRLYTEEQAEMLRRAREDLLNAKVICTEESRREHIRSEWSRRVRAWSPTLADLLSVLTEPAFRQAGQQDNLWQLLLARLDIICARPHRLCVFVIKTATLLGLALTFVGIIEALQAFEGSRHDIQGLIAGFYTALGSTIIGIVAALAGILAISLNQTSQETQYAVLEQLLRQLAVHTAQVSVQPGVTSRKQFRKLDPKTSDEKRYHETQTPQ
jgi:biopolymer transport protein ExbB/TolQ